MEPARPPWDAQLAASWLRTEIAGAFVDLGSIAEAWPRQPEDPFGTALMLVNLRAMWRNFRLAGARRLVVAGVIESADDRSAHELALDGTPMSVCRLVAPVPVLQERIRQREPLASREWHVARAAELTAILDLTDVADFVVDNEFGDPTAVAQTVLASAGWLNGAPADE